MTFEEFAARHGPTMRRFAAVMTGDHASGDDIVQEVLLRTHARWRRISALDRPEFYVRRMIVNEFLSARRRLWRLVPGGTGTDVDDRVTPDHAASLADRDALVAEIRRLPRQQRAVVALRYFAAGRPKLDNAPTDLRFGPHKLHIGETGLGKLPTNPARLAIVIKSRRFEGGPPGPAEDFAQVADLLRDMNAPPALRAAAFEVGARIPRVTSLGVVSFHGVRGLGIVIGHPVPGQPRERGVNELIFNRTTSRLKAEVAMTVKSGKVIDITWVTYRSSGLVNSTTSTP